eukprot:7388871-Prymnesium_polylepis.1
MHGAHTPVYRPGRSHGPHPYTGRDAATGHTRIPAGTLPWATPLYRPGTGAATDHTFTGRGAATGHTRIPAGDGCSHGPHTYTSQTPTSRPLRRASRAATPYHGPAVQRRAAWLAPRAWAFRGPAGGLRRSAGKGR